MTARRVAVVGAGVAGVACASHLQSAGMEVQVFDQAGWPGGRCATLHTPAGVFHHGAAGFDGCAEAFEGQVSGLAAGLVLGHEVAAIEPAGSGRWSLRFHAGRACEGPFDAVVVAAPPEPAAVLLQVAGELAAALRCVRSEPCWSVVAAWAAPLGLEAAAIASDALLQHVRQQEGHPGSARVAGCASRWVLQATSYWSANNLDVPPEQVMRHLLDAFGKAAGRRLARPAFAAAHLWRQARVPQPLADACGWNPALRLGSCGDAWSGTAGMGGVERAWSSGRALAGRVLDAT